MKKLILLVMLISAGSTYAQNHTIKGKIKGVNPSDTVFLAQYMGKSLHYNDTTVCEKDGWFSFEGKPYELGGKYVVFIMKPKVKMVEVLLDTEDLVFETDTANMDLSMKVLKSENNKIWYDYKKFIHSKNNARAPFDKVCNDTLLTEKDRKVGCDKIRELTKEVIAEQKRIVTDHADMLVGKFIKMGLELEVPDAPETAEDKRTWSYNYYRDHYWDNVDLDDPRIIREQLFHRVLEKYVTKVILQNPDSVFHYGSALADKVEKTPETFKYVITQLTYLSESSKVMCMDKAFVMFVNKYYKTGKVDWLTDDKLSKIIEGADKKTPTLCGEIAPNIILPNPEDVWTNLQQVDSEYTILVFWEPSCGHCKKEMPKLQTIYEDWKDKGLEIYAVCHDIENEDWLEFIEEKELDWINVSFNEAIMNQDSATKLILGGVTTLQSLNYGTTYDISSTPQIYLLDKDKTILFKQLNAEQLEKMMENLLGKEEEKEENEQVDEMKEEKKEEVIIEKSKREKKQKKTK